MKAFDEKKQDLALLIQLIKSGEALVNKLGLRQLSGLERKVFLAVFDLTEHATEYPRLSLILQHVLLCEYSKPAVVRALRILVDDKLLYQPKFGQYCPT